MACVIVMYDHCGNRRGYISHDTINKELLTTDFAPPLDMPTVFTSTDRAASICQYIAEHYKSSFYRVGLIVQ